MSLLTDARAGFILKGSSLRQWCRDNGVDPGYAHKVMAGRLNGPAAKALRQRIIAASSPKAGNDDLREQAA